MEKLKLVKLNIWLCMGKKLTYEDFVEKAKKVHGDKYVYSKVEYKNSQTKVCIICPIHGEFWQTPNSHLSGQGCKFCNHQSYKHTTDEFIEIAKQVHGDKYDYSKVEYVDCRTKVCIICPIHGEFLQAPHKHTRCEQGCPKCRKNQKMTRESFVEKAKKIHSDKYDYSNVEYTNSDTKVCIICPIHGEFWQTPHGHLNGKGCCQCKNETNVSETKLFSFLEKNLQTKIIREAKLDFLKNKRIDIFLPEFKIGIEYQGIQHFQPVNFFGGVKKFAENVERDKMKYKLCKENGIQILYFSYEKKTPPKYIDKIYKNENELLKEIIKYGNNSRIEGFVSRGESQNGSSS